MLNRLTFLKTDLIETRGVNNLSTLILVAFAVASVEALRFAPKPNSVPDTVVRGDAGNKAPY